MPLSSIQTDYTPGRPNKQALDRRRPPDEEVHVESGMELATIISVGPTPGIAAETSAAIANLEQGASVALDFAVRRYASV